MKTKGITFSSNQNEVGNNLFAYYLEHFIIKHSTN